MNGENNFIPIRQASQFTGLCPQTLRTYANAGKIKCYTTESGQRRFDKQSLKEMFNPSSHVKQADFTKKENFLYARVSSKKQEDDLLRQVSFLKSRRHEYSSYTSISDVASGINFKRKGLSDILDSCLKNTIGEVVVAHKDRLSRFGFDLINLIVTKAGGRIVVIDDERNKTSEQELSEDLLSIVHIYSCRQLGKRSYNRRKHFKIPENETEIVV